jgi:hypothetical protein
MNEPVDPLSRKQVGKLKVPKATMGSVTQPGFTEVRKGFYLGLGFKTARGCRLKGPEPRTWRTECGGSYL